ncbi:uncharacterized protein LOC130567266 [Triplophysa rosa]|uniref:Immunoglobulin V-set domain-containing protein n=1 Tax=Triplophysa rosa TaxID=992332 RepID=A0A9W7WGQ6_TRIRA|nr:uncharacterized protein LOC130567266 [Triplophysa rosa]KAI7798495.1 hypothetical protein IRJ41_004161 [Triplophysa rosa]
MEKIILFYVFSSWIMHITYSDVSVPQQSFLLRAQLGKSISLNCTMLNRYEIAWHHLNCEQLTLLVTAEKDSKTGEKLLITYNQNKNHLELKANSGITVVSLVISEVTQSDLGLYFCGTKSDTPKMHFDRAIRLQTEENLRLRKENCNSQLGTEQVEITDDDLTVKERVLMFGGVGLAIVIFFLATVAAGGVIHHRGWQKGWTAGKGAIALSSD